MQDKTQKKIQKIYKNTTGMIIDYKQSSQQKFNLTNLQLFSRKNTYKTIASNQIYIKRYASQQQLKKKIILQKMLNTTKNYRLLKSKTDSQKLKSEKAIEVKYQKTKLRIQNLETQTSSVDTLHHSKKIIPNFLKPQLTKREQKQPVILKLGIESFVILKKLGRGRFGEVYMVKQKKTGFICAMKVVQKQKISSNGLQQFLRQLKIQSFLNHPNIIEIYGFFHDSQLFYVLMELGNDGQLYSVLKNKGKLTEESTSYVSKNLLQAVVYLHSFGIIHRDIKPQNVVLAMGCVKLCDFGWAVRREKQSLRNTYCGTPLYLSPQILINQGYDQKVDLWSIGILTYELLIGHPPFNIKSHKDLNMIITQKIQYPSKMKLSKQFLQFIETVLNKNPDKRETCSKLLQLKFIKKYAELQICDELCI